MKQFLLIITILTVLTACKKGQADITITGTLLEATTLQPISGATIELVKVYATEETSVATITTDSEGKYSFTTQRDRFQSIKVSASKHGYFSETNSIIFNDITVKEDNVLNMKTTGKSWVRIRLVHTDSPDTKLDVLRTQGKSGCADCCPDGYRHFEGNIDTTYYCINDAGTMYQITYFGQNPIFSGTREATTVFMDTVDILLQY